MRGCQATKFTQNPWNKSASRTAAIICPDLALMFSPESPSLLYYSDSLPRKGNSSRGCRLTSSGNASDHCSSSAYGTRGCDWPYASFNQEEKSFFVFSIKRIDRIQRFLRRPCAVWEQCSYNHISPAGHLLIKEAVHNERNRSRPILWDVTDSLLYNNSGTYSFISEILTLSILFQMFTCGAR